MAHISRDWQTGQRMPNFSGQEVEPDWTMKWPTFQETGKRGAFHFHGSVEYNGLRADKRIKHNDS